MSSRKTILEIINDNSLILYTLLKEKKIKTKVLYEALQTKDKEIILNKMVPVSDKKIQNLKTQYPKSSCIDEILFLTDNRYRHLKEIRKLVNIQDIVEFCIPDKLYLEKINIHYTDRIIDLLIEDFYDHKSLHQFFKLRKKLIVLDSKQNQKIIKNMDRYYIQKITI